MIKVQDYMANHKLFTVKQIAEAAGCSASLIMKYIQDGVRGAGKLEYETLDEKGQILVSLRALEEFAHQHSGYAHYYATKAANVLRGESHESH